MDIPSAYTNNYGHLKDFFEKIREGQAPDKFTREHLKDLGFRSSHHHSFIPILKGLGFLSSDGTPTQTYLDYMDRSQSGQILALAVKNAYKPIFTIKAHPSKADKAAIEGKFKTAFNSTDAVAQTRANTFFSLLELCDLEAIKSGSAATIKLPKPADEETEEMPPSVPANGGKNSNSKNTSAVGLHYNIQIHLPPTKDIEVYNAIFKSIKEHLID